MITESSSANFLAAAAYARTQAGAATSHDSDATFAGGGGSVQGFGAALENAVEDFVSSGKTAEKKAASGLRGQGNLTDIVTSVSEAQMVLQTASAVRDRVIQSYQEIMRMTI
ncbi:flagellar hook-basal body protein FleE [Acetobacter nitrogenifigens DSM 23921 = NBRC 105050]|uniref:Flagellar hook-basal body complex protein FliE n=1 Tax=Acetobacter nitrogenifigens DSM 23921 = NBRC 105050 TaxID=1120919 RepID=A0A511XB86_9PROT|nr:flagellar hook-basal body complex protein FliE [Acetobacter nitrogenifigens]GBQ92990.1 flagellar hook-basal body protein FleE [Acetobacter nitrogenifigens DSM 23921 = NBRC 105050]GEN60186.1 flagellar hook-basal body complex protein FliE [Acetobacter nitrogenifigens DSM 23921 = NBRC 105050]